MKLVNYTCEYYEAWQTLCEKSQDSWFWHTRSWYEYSMAYMGENFIQDTSILILSDSNEPVALAPSMAVTNFQKKRVLGLGDSPVPWPVFSGALSISQRDNVEKIIYNWFYESAIKLKLENIKCYGVVPSESFFDAANVVINMPVRHGYIGSDSLTHIIDLRVSNEDLWKGVRKGHKSAIKKGGKALKVHKWINQINDDDFNEYVKMHALAAGRVTRSKTTFDLMRDWIREGNALLVGATINDEWIGFVYFILYKNAAFYASAANHPEAPSSSNIGHVLIWSVIEKLQQMGVKIVEMGTQTYASPHKNSDQKLLSISRFKRGFGGVAMPRFEATLDISI